MTGSVAIGGDQSPQLVPEILFTAETIGGPEGASTQSAEFIRKDTVLIRLAPLTTADPKQLPCSLVEGENSYLSEDKTEIFSKVDGFPTLTKSVKKGVDLYLLSITPLIRISADKMKADITLFPPVTGGVELTCDLVKEVFADNDVHFGFHDEQIQQLLNQCKENQEIISREPIAKGILPLNGKDSYLRFAIEVGPLPGKILGNGKIDFRERRMFVGVKEGQIIATRVPATAGTPGLNIAKEQVPPLPGRELPVTTSDDALYDENNGTIVAGKSGILSMVGDNSIKVCAKQVISGNIDYSTGNIESQDAVEISGTILPGFKVTTFGDLLVGGNARSATIKCKGNLVIKGGILGTEGKASVSGDADFLFMEQSHLRGKKNVIIRKQSYHGEIMADGDIICEASSQIMAGQLICGGSIVLGSVGSSHSPAALIAAGVSPGIYLRYLSLRSKLIESSEELSLFLQRFGKKKKVEERKSLKRTIRILKKEMRRLDLLPGNTKAEKKQSLAGTTITVQGSIFPGTEIQIGNSSKIIHTTRTKTRFLLDAKSRTFIETEL